MKNHQISSCFIMWVVALSIIGILFLLPVKINAQGSKANFSGSWAFNESKSNLGEGRGFRNATLITITQSGINLSVARQRTNQNGEAATTTEKYTLDGKECVNTSGRGPSKSVVTWSSDGKILNFATTRSSDRNGETTEIKSTEVWSLTDAKTLSIISSFVRQGDERKTSLIYDKK